MKITKKISGYVTFTKEYDLPDEVFRNENIDEVIDEYCELYFDVRNSLGKEFISVNLDVDSVDTQVGEEI